MSSLRKMMCAIHQIQYKMIAQSHWVYSVHVCGSVSTSGYCFLLSGMLVYCLIYPAAYL